MRRREFITLLGGAAAWPLAIRAQDRRPTIGLLRTNAPPDPFAEAFREGMRAIGYEDGRTVTYVMRWADGNPERLPALASELAALNVAVIVTGGRPPFSPP